MSNLEVLFHIPQHIAAGLGSGVFQRIGGVIVERDSKQVVAWLRDGIGHQNNPDAPRLFSQAITGMSATGQVLNLALTGITLVTTMRRLDQLSQQIDALSEIVRSEFKRERDARFKRALQSARDAFESNHAANRENAAQRAIDSLYEAREQLLEDFRAILQSELTFDRLQVAQHYLVRALYAETSRIRCYLINDETELAKKRLSEDLSALEQASQELIRAWLGAYPAAYLHRDVPADDMRRFMHIQRWLYGDDASTTSDEVEIFLQIIDQLRGDFWNQTALQNSNADVLKQIADSPLVRRIRGQQPVEAEDRVKVFAERLNNAELIIENTERLRGFEYELRSMRLSVDAWDHLISEEDLNQYGIGIIIDSDMAQAYQA